MYSLNTFKEMIQKLGALQSRLEEPIIFELPAITTLLSVTSVISQPGWILCFIVLFLFVLLPNLVISILI